MSKSLSHQHRKDIELEIRETNLEAQLFFRSQGFRAVEIVQGYYDEPDEDAITFRYRLGDKPPFLFTNRITKYEPEEWNR